MHAKCVDRFDTFFEYRQTSANPRLFSRYLRRFVGEERVNEPVNNALTGVDTFFQIDPLGVWVGRHNHRLWRLSPMAAKPRFDLPSAHQTFASWQDCVAALTGFQHLGLDPRQFLECDTHEEQWLLTWALWTLWRDSTKTNAEARGQVFETHLTELGIALARHIEDWNTRHSEATEAGGEAL